MQYFNFLSVCRSLSLSLSVSLSLSRQKVIHYLVKWKSLPYEDSTWELEVSMQKSKRHYMHMYIM